MKIRKALILPLIVSMLLGVFMVGPVGAQPTTIGVEPIDTVNPDLVPGSKFAVEIWIRDVEDLAGLEFTLGYDTTVLTADSIAYGDIFGDTYFPLISDINEAEGYLIYGIMEALGEPSFYGDGRVAIINFTVDSLGDSVLDLYDTQLGDTSLPIPKPIPHAALDGYFNNVPPPSVTLATRKAWPEHHNFEVWWDEDSSNDLFAIVKNDGTEDTYIKVVFTVTLGGIPMGDFETQTVALEAGAMYGKVKPYNLKAAFVPPMLGKYYVSAQCWADTNLDTVPDTPMGLVKLFAFRVVLELL